jgi:predicted DNA binding protein
MKFTESAQEYFASVRFSMKHEGCWTELTGNSNVKVHTLISRPFREKKFILGVIEVKSSTIDSFKKFIVSLRKSVKVIEILDIVPIDIQRRLFRVSFKEVYNDMVSSVLYEHSSIYQNDLIFGDHENITAVLPRSEISQLSRDLKNLGSLEYFKVLPSDIKCQLPITFDLSESEKKSLAVAIELGYYVIPRKSHLEDVCGLLNISKSTLQENLRKAENKILSSWARENLLEPSVKCDIKHSSEN